MRNEGIMRSEESIRNESALQHVARIMMHESNGDYFHETALQMAFKCVFMLNAGQLANGIRTKTSGHLFPSSKL